MNVDVISPSYVFSSYSHFSGCWVKCGNVLSSAYALKHSAWLGVDIELELELDTAKKGKYTKLLSEFGMSITLGIIEDALNRNWFEKNTEIWKVATCFYFKRVLFQYNLLL